MIISGSSFGTLKICKHDCTVLHSYLNLFSMIIHALMVINTLIIFSSIGHEYEFLLRRNLEKLNISYHNEDELRLKGYDKTPDIKLDIPIGRYILTSFELCN